MKHEFRESKRSPGPLLSVCFAALIAMFALVAKTDAQQNTLTEKGPANTSSSGSAAIEKDVSASAAADLQKAAQNPVANLISVPLQNNSNFGVGPYSRTQDVLNVQPVIPIKINEDWMVINRIIQPIVWQPYSGASGGGEYGLGYTSWGMRLQIAFLFPKLRKQQEKMIMEQKLKQLETGVFRPENELMR